MIPNANDNTRFSVTFTEHEIATICQSLINIKMVSRDYDTIRLCIALLGAFNRSLNN